MTIKTGDSHRLNILSGVSTIVTETADQIQQTGKPLPKGLMIYNTDTRELKVSDGVRAPGELLDHTHNAPDIFIK